MRIPTFRRSWVIAVLLASTACTQEAAKIDLRGQNNYSRDGSANYGNNSYSSSIAFKNSGTPTSSYSSYSPAAGSANTQSSATVQSIGVSDLGAPPGGNKTTTAWGRPVAKPASASTPASAPFKKSSVEAVTTAPTATMAARASEPLQAQAAPSERVNPWTGKPREVAAAQPANEQSFSISPKDSALPAREPMVSEINPASKTPAASVESIVASSDDAPAPLSPSRPGKVSTASSGFMWPVESKKIASQFGPKGKGKASDGIAIASAKGEPVWASADGEVVYVGNELQGYGNMVLIKHSGNKSTTYAHLSRYTVDKYERVKQGDIIGYVGNTGNTKQSQLYFAIRDGKDAVDPMKHLKRNVASLR